MPADAFTSAGLYCPGCGYDLRNLQSARCPECGLTIDTTRSGIIPWENRRSLGYIRSFFKTLLLATFSPVKLARAVQWPIDVRSARLFRWIVRVLIMLPVVGVFVCAVINNGGPDELRIANTPVNERFTFSPLPFWEARWIWSAGATWWPILPMGFSIALILATGVSRWFGTREQTLERQNRAMAFSYYLFSPLAWIVFPSLLVSGVMVINSKYGNSPPFDIGSLASAMGLGLIICVGLLGLMQLNAIRAIGVVCGCEFLRSVMIGIGIVLQAVMAALLGIGVFPLLAGLLRIMIASVFR